MRIIYCGDVVGRSGREVVLKNLAWLRQTYKADLVLVNAENSAHGFGATPGICKDFLLDFIQNFHSTFFLARIHMRVCIPSLPDIRMTESARDLLDIDAFIAKQRCVRMAEIVYADMWQSSGCSILTVSVVD